MMNTISALMDSAFHVAKPDPFGLINVARPVFMGNERRYVLDVMESGWLSQGEYVLRFEAEIAKAAGTRHAIAVTSGTAALHLALLALGIKRGEGVIVPDLTFVATANAASYVGATPILTDVEAKNGCMSYITAQQDTVAAAAIFVHLFGYPTEPIFQRNLREFFARDNTPPIPIIEDAAEALGGELRGKKVGSIGKLACFSFYANKTICCGEGGAITTDDDALAERLRFLRGQAHAPDVGGHYWHTEVGYNYRMTDLQAAVGLGQIERLDEHLGARQRVSEWYQEELGDWKHGRLLAQSGPHIKHAHWMVAVVLEARGHDNVPLARQHVMREMEAANIETRPVFTPLHQLPMYKQPGPFPVATKLGTDGIVLPTHAALTREQVHRVCRTLRGAVLSAGVVG